MISRIKTNEKVLADCRAFTLVEILMVTLIIALAAGGVSLALWANIDQARIQAACRRIAGDVTYAQSLAVLNAKDIVMTYDIDNHSYRIASDRQIQEDDDAFLTEIIKEQGDAKGLPKGVSIVDIYLSSFEMHNFGEVRVRFSKDGWVMPHIIHLGIQNDDYVTEIYTLKVNPLTGNVEIFDEEKDWDDLML